MQAKDLWAGSDYAYYEYRGNNTFVMNAKRVRIIRVFQKKDAYYSQRAASYADVHLIDDDGNILKRQDGTEFMRTVRARDIIDHWDSYVDERDERQRKMDERARIQEEHERQRKLKDEAIIDFLVDRGIPRNAISAGYGNTVSISKEVIWQWMKEQREAVSSQ